MKYLQKIGLAFQMTKSDTKVNLNLIRNNRDRKYFEIYQLKQEYEANNMDEAPEKKELDANDLVWPEFFKSETDQINNEDTAAENVSASKISEGNDSNESTDGENEESAEDDYNEEIESITGLEDSSRKNKSRIIVRNV